MEEQKILSVNIKTLLITIKTTSIHNFCAALCRKISLLVTASSIVHIPSQQFLIPGICTAVSYFYWQIHDSSAEVSLSYMYKGTMSVCFIPSVVTACLTVQFVPCLHLCVLPSFLLLPWNERELLVLPGCNASTYPCLLFSIYFLQLGGDT